MIEKNYFFASPHPTPVPYMLPLLYAWVDIRVHKDAPFIRKINPRPSRKNARSDARAFRINFYFQYRQENIDQRQSLHLQQNQPLEGLAYCDCFRLLEALFPQL